MADWTPLDLATPPVRWYDFSGPAGVVHVAPPAVSRLVNLANPGVGDAVQDVGINAPNLTGVIGTRSAAQFEPANNSYMSAAPLGLGPGDHRFVISIVQGHTYHTGTIFNTRAAASGSWRLYLFGTNWSGENVLVPATGIDQPEIIAVDQRGPGESENGIIMNGGSRVTSGKTGLDDTIDGDLQIGRRRANDYYFDGLIGELIFLDYVPGQDTIDKLFGYLAHKWGVATLLPSDPLHPYRDTAPQSDTPEAFIAAPAVAAVTGVGGAPALMAGSKSLPVSRGAEIRGGQPGLRAGGEVRVVPSTAVVTPTLVSADVIAGQRRGGGTGTAQATRGQPDTLVRVFVPVSAQAFQLQGGVPGIDPGLIPHPTPGRTLRVPPPSRVFAV